MTRGGLGGIALRAIAASGLASLLAPQHHYGRTRRPKGYTRGNSIADKPHAHEREIARRKRQAERDEKNRLARAYRLGRAVSIGTAVWGVSRRGKAVRL